MKKILYNEKGFSFLMVFFTMILISILGIGLISVSANSLKISTNEREDQSVYYIAEAGLAVKKSEVENELLGYYKEIKAHYDKLPTKKKLEYEFETEFYKKVDSKLNLSPTNLRNFESQFGNSPTANVTISKISSGIFPLEYKMTSVGKIGKKERTVTQIITIDLNMDKPPSNGQGKYAVHTKGILDISGGTQIYGSIATESGQIIFDNSSANVTGDIHTSYDNFKIIGNKANSESLFNKVTGHDSLPPIILPPFPDEEFTRLQALPYPENLEVKKDDWNKTLVINNGSFLADNHITSNFQYNMTNDVRFKEFKVNEYKTIIINVGDSDKNLFVENFNIEGGHIKVIGNGKLNIYVKDSFLIIGSFNTDGDYNKVNFYYANTTPIDFANGTHIFSSFYSKNAALGFTGGVGILGNIYTGGSSLKINGGSNTHSQHFYAPNAKVEVSGGANIKGAVIADSFYASGGSSIRLDSDSDTNSGSNGVTEYPDSISLTKKSSIIEEN